MTRKSLYARTLWATAVGTGLATALFAGQASALSLEEALVQAYQTNPTLAAQRAKLRATDEGVPQAKAGYRPVAKVTGSVQRQAATSEGVTPRTGSPNSVKFTEGADSWPKALGVTVSQSVYDATVTPGVKSAEAAIEAQRAVVVATEESVLLSAATAYLDVVQNQAVVDLNANNVAVLKRQLDAAQDRFRVGEYTRTDVALSESRLAGAQAAKIQADGTLQSSKATFERYVGVKPGALKSAKPKFRLPTSLDEAVSLAQSNNPNVIAASFAEQAQQHLVDQNLGAFMPSVGVSVTAGRTWNPMSTTTGQLYDHQDSLVFGGQVVIPLYQAGLPDAKVRAAKQTANQYRIQITDTRNQITESTISAWQALQTARANIESYKTQIKAAEIALEGNRQAAQVGSGTVLDVLDRDQELLTARVALVQAERGEAVASFTILAAVGELTAQGMALPAERYNPDKNYEATKDRWFGTDVEE